MDLAHLMAIRNELVVGQALAKNVRRELEDIFGPEYEEYVKLLLYWQRTDKKILKRINVLINDIQKNEYQGIGKPEAIRHSLTGYWSRRITNEHRIVYKVRNGQVLIAQLRYHY